MKNEEFTRRFARDISGVAILNYSFLIIHFLTVVFKEVK